MIKKTTIKAGKNQKISRKVQECRSHLNHKLFSEIFISDPLKIFSKPLGTINIRTP